MRTRIDTNSFTIWLSAHDTYSWAHRSGSSWPCSESSDKRCRADFDENGLVDLTVNGREASAELSAWELNAIVSDYAREVLPSSHPVWDVVIGQFSD